MNTPLPEQPRDDAAATSPAPPPQAKASAGVDADLQALAAQAMFLEQRGRAGASWFYWVAALSLVNSTILLFGGDIHFVIGLGVTLVVDAVAASLASQSPELGHLIKAVAFAFNFFVILIVAGFGWLALRRYQAAFALGMALYLLDGILFALFQVWLSVAFHAFVLFCMWSGFRAYHQLNALETALPTADVGDVGQDVVSQ